MKKTVIFSCAPVVWTQKKAREVGWMEDPGEQVDHMGQVDVPELAGGAEAPIPTPSQCGAGTSTAITTLITRHILHREDGQDPQVDVVGRLPAFSAPEAREQTVL